MTWSVKNTRERMEGRSAGAKQYRGKAGRLPSSRRHGAKGFPMLVATLAGCTFLGVYGLLTPGKLTASDSAYYPNCDAAGAAGAAPLYQGEPGYRSRLDRDSDGIACEPYY